jgi:CubicO group peptidase (beta-lactamase class C family)
VGNRCRHFAKSLIFLSTKPTFMRSFALSGFLLFIIACSSAQSNSLKKSTLLPSQAAVFDKYIQDAMPLWKVPGLSVAVVKDGKVIFKKGYGTTELGKATGFDTSTLSICASTTKAMTAVCVGMLVDEGKLKWDDKVEDILPGFKINDAYATSQITVKDLLTHNAGLGNADWLWIVYNDDNDIIQRMQYLTPAYSLRSSFIYQNLMYGVAGKVIEKVSGKKWEDYITENLFHALGMNRTYATYSYSVKETDRISPHFMINDSVNVIPYIDYPGVSAAGAVWSCANDISKWMMFMLDSARWNGRRLLKPETFAELMKPQAIIPANEFYPTMQITKPHWTTYGLGWFQQDYRGKMVEFHTGSLDGAVAIIGLIPDEHFGIYIFENLDHAELRHALMFKAFDLWVFNDNTKDWSGDFLKLYTKLKADAKNKQKEKDAKRVLGTRPSLAMQDYTGKYSSDIYGEADIKVEGGSLSIKYPNNNVLKLEHWNYDIFRGSFNNFWWDKASVQFFLNTEGRVSYFEMDGMRYKKIVEANN